MAQEMAADTRVMVSLPDLRHRNDVIIDNLRNTFSQSKIMKRLTLFNFQEKSYNVKTEIITETFRQ